ncbi:MAG: hypothetical protein LBK23_02180 [Oscillospiraceae bacterium]|jgi:hypothetical protein|nr:hypothetical protein [Oscillospiraceae bacterium]
MDKNKRPRPMGLNIGSASIIMLFAVLCLTVLAVLSLLSANSQYALAERSADVARTYYEADTRAAEIYERIKNGDYGADGEIEIEAYITDGGAATFSYEVPAGARQALRVELTRAETGELRVDMWKLTEAGDWIPDESINLWLGGDE